MVSDGHTSPRARGGDLDPTVKAKIDQFLAERSVSFPFTKTSFIFYAIIVAKLSGSRAITLFNKP
jgi:hypothetical protein